MNEQEFHNMVNRNICLRCEGSGLIDRFLSSSIGNICYDCMGSGKRFQHLLKDGILEK